MPSDDGGDDDDEEQEERESERAIIINPIEIAFLLPKRKRFFESV